MIKGVQQMNTVTDPARKVALVVGANGVIGRSLIWTRLELAQDNFQNNDTFPFLPVHASFTKSIQRGASKIQVLDTVTCFDVLIIYHYMVNQLPMCLP